MKYPVLVALTFAAALPLKAQVPTSATDERLAAGLRQYPEADVNKDGVLTMQEAKAFLSKRRADKAGSKTSQTKGTAPTFTDVAYGPFERNKLDFWQTAQGTGAAPVVVFIHGGGFVGGDKSKWQGSPVIESLLKSGVSCAAINYRFRDSAPIQDILHDAARAVQFIRSKSADWKVDKAHIAATGGSAGAGTSLWLDARDDLADPSNSDPVLRESSRVCAAVLHATQATYDLSRWPAIVGAPKPEWMASPDEDLQFYHLPDRAAMTSESGRQVLKECDMLGWINPGDGPVLCVTRVADMEKPITNRGEWLHHPKHAAAIGKTCADNQVICTLEEGSNTREVAFLLKHLGIAPGAQSAGNQDSKKATPSS